jgi:uncharacterized protein YidB (DUF937 family)
MGHRYVSRGADTLQETTMGLLDILNGMQNGPRGPSAPSAPSDGKEGMSPMTMAILALLAYKAVKHIGGGQAQAPAQAPAGPATLPGTTTASTGGLGGGLGGLLGGLLAGGAAGSVLSGGLGDLLKQFQEKGQGDAANSWVSNGPNKQIAPGDLASALGADQIDSIAAQSGMSRDDLLKGLSQYLPDVINHLTPDGRVPNEHEISGRL